MSERVVVQLNINANKKEDVYYKDKNKCKCQSFL